jgi:hypothetical protein
MPARITSLFVMLTLLMAVVVPARGEEYAVARIAAAKALDHEGYVPALARGVAATESEPNDTPATANPISVGVAMDAALTGVADEDWFSVSATSGEFLTLSTSAVVDGITDTVLEVYASDGLARIAMDDDSGMGLFSALRDIEVPTDGILLLRITRYSALGDDGYRILAEAGTSPPPAPGNDAIASAEELTGCSTAVTGSTEGATNEVGELACLAIDPLGGEVFYRISVPFSFQLSILAEPTGGWDLSIYVFSDPADPAGSCVDAADIAYAGEAETVSFVNDDLAEESAELYIAVDSWTAATTGSFILSAQCDFVVPNKLASFGTLKARFQVD